MILFCTIAGVPHHTTQLNCIQLNCNLPIGQIAAGLQVECMVNWPIRCECPHLGFAENLHTITLYCQDESSILSSHHIFRCASTFCRCYFSVGTWYEAVWRNIQEAGKKTVCQNRGKPHHQVLLFVSRQANNVYTRIPWGVSCWPLLLLLSAHPSSAWSLSHSPFVMPLTVTPSSPGQAPTLRKNDQMTCSLASSSSIAGAPSIWIFKGQRPLNHVSSLAVMLVQYWGVPAGPSGPLRSLRLSLGMQHHQGDSFARRR